MTAIRKAYILRLITRCFILAGCVLLFVFHPSQFTVLENMNFFGPFSLLHLLWIVWVADMIVQLVPIRERVPLGSQKLFRQRFQPIREKINYQALRQYILFTTKAAYKVMLLWAALLTAIGICYFSGRISDPGLFLISVVFYVCDLICVLIWCPFRLILKNRCCTTCRIFNWDHLMMFTPMLFIKGFYSRSLLILSVVVWLVWEVCVLLYPERFWEYSNEALQCSACTDKLCTQYCQKLRTGIHN